MHCLSSSDFSVNCERRTVNRNFFFVPLKLLYCVFPFTAVNSSVNKNHNLILYALSVQLRFLCELRTVNCEQKFHLCPFKACVLHFPVQSCEQVCEQES